MKRWTIAALLFAVVLITSATTGQAKVVHENTDDLPPGCDEIQDEVAFTVHGGRHHAEEFNGAVFTFDNRSWEVGPCTLVTITFVNDDDVRHQFMVHDTYPNGFFQIELTGPAEETGSFITTAEAKSLLVHCGVAQHQQKGMKAQILQNGGEGDIPNILGISGLPPEDRPDADQANGDGDGEQPIPWIGPELVLLFIGLALLARSRRS